MIAMLPMIRKALAAAVLAGASALVAAAQAGPLSTGSYTAVLLAALVAGIGVYLIPNKAPGPVLTQADAAADLAGTPRPDNPTQ